MEKPTSPTPDGAPVGDESRAGALILALVIGFGMIPFIVYFVHWYEVVIFTNAYARQVLINALPPAILSLFMILTLVVNPLVRLAVRPLALASRELTIILILWLFTGAVAYINLTLPALATAGLMNSPAMDKPAFKRVGIKDYLRQDMFLPEPAARDYYYGISADGTSRVRFFAPALTLKGGDIQDIGGLAAQIVGNKDPLSALLGTEMSEATQAALTDLTTSAAELSARIAGEFNALLRDSQLYDEARYAAVLLSDDLRRLGSDVAPLPPAQRLAVNRQILEATFPVEVAKTGESANGALADGDIIGGGAFFRTLLTGGTPPAAFLGDALSSELKHDLHGFAAKESRCAELVAEDVNRILSGPLLFARLDLGWMNLPDAIRSLINRQLIEAAYPDELARPGVAVPWAFQASDIRDAATLAARLRQPQTALDHWLAGGLKPATQEKLAAGPQASPAAPEDNKAATRPEDALAVALAAELNAVIAGPIIYRAERFDAKTVPAHTTLLINRAVLENAYVRELAKVPPSVPWALWRGPLRFWLPLVLVMVLFSSSLVRAMHRQWSQHELLTYPLVSLTEPLVTREPGRALPSIFYNKIFWAGFAISAFIFTINGLKTHFPIMIEIPMRFTHINVINKFPFLSKYCGREAYALFRGFVYPFMIAIAVLLPTELSLTSWLGWVLMVFGTGVYFRLTGEVITGTETNMIQYGMFVVMAISILFIGRREYANVLRSAFFLGRQGHEDPGLRRAVRACRLFLLSFVAFWSMLAAAGLDWFLAFVLVCSVGLVVLLVARLTAETGIPWLVNFAGMASGFPVQLLGAAALGPKGLILIAAMSAMIDSETSNSVAAQATTKDKLCERSSHLLRGPLFSVILAIGVGIAVASSVGVALWNNYSFGARQERLDGAFTGRIQSATNEINRLQAENRIDAVSATAGMQKLTLMRFDGKFWRFFLIGAVVVALCSIMRFHFLWWPFHPLPLLFINSWAMSRLYFSVLLGWLIKMAILRVWGGKTFTQLKPFFVGVVAGQILIYGIWLLINSVYFLLTNTRPPSFGGPFY